MTPRLRKALFETLYRNAVLYRFASTVPFAGQWRAWQRQILPRLHGHEVLELGCGPGDLLADMLDAGYACRAIERSPQMARAARATLKKRHAGSSDLVIQGSAQALPFANASFDCVVSTFPTEYIYDPATLAEVERVLRHGGRLIVIEGAALLPVGFFQSLLLLLQTLVYGPDTPSQRRAAAAGHGPGDALEAETSWGQRIPLEQVGLRRRSEIARSRRWEVSLTFGEKA